jgi:MFS family permease
LRRGVAVTRRDHDIRIVFVATMIVNGAGMVSWLFPQRLVDLGFPNNPILWYTALGIVASALGAAALRIVESRLDGVGVARRVYALACVVGTLGLVVLAIAPNAVTGSLGVLLVAGIAFNVTRAISVIWVNRRTSSDVRATVHSFLSQAESVGEICAGFALAFLAHTAGTTATLVTAGAVMATAGVTVARSHADRMCSPTNAPDGSAKMRRSDRQT